MKKTSLKISNITCTNCATTITEHFKRLGGITAKVIVGPKKVNFEYDETKYNEAEIINQLHIIGYYPLIDDEETKKQKRKDLVDLIISIGFTIPLIWTMISHIGGSSLEFLVPDFMVNGWFQLAVTIPVLFVAGRRFFKATYYQIKNRNLGMDSLVVLGTTAAFLYSLFLTIYGQIEFQTATFNHHNISTLFSDKMLFFETSAMVIMMVIIGNYFENRVKEKTSDSLQALISLGSTEARVLRNDVVVLVGIDEIQLGETIIVLANEKIPLDGVVTEGNSYLDEAMLTGESMPSFKKVGDTVIGAAMNLTQTLSLRVTAIGSETVLAKIIQTVEETTLIKPKAQRIADRISKYFVPVVVAISILTIIVWVVLSKTNVISQNWSVGIGAGIAVLVVSCPCALGLATPMSVAVSSGKAYENSILYRGGEFFELANKIEAIAFDKTGTLTSGKPVVTNFFGDLETLKYTKSLEKDSNHPLASAVMDYETDLVALENLDFEVLIGQGVKGTVNGRQVYVGSYNLIKSLKVVNAFQSKYDEFIVRGQGIIFTVIDNIMVNMITVEDEVKPEVFKTLKELEKRNIETHMITGDSLQTATYIAEKLGIKNVHAEVLPHEKADIVKSIQATGKIVAFVGDGINDAPALKMADISFAIGTGSDIAIDSSDVTLMKHDLGLVIDAIDLSKATIRNIWINFAWAFSYNVILIPMAAFNIIHPAFAGIGMGLSSILVVLNSLLLKLWKPKFKKDAI